MAKTLEKLLAVAHPDDESLFFGLMLLESQKSSPATEWTLFCASQGGFGGEPARRRGELERACKRLGIGSIIVGDFDDDPKRRWEQSELKTALKKLSKAKTFDEVYTHGILGEYGHPAHQDLSFAAHDLFCPLGMAVWSPAWHCYPERVVAGSAKDFLSKQELMTTVYAKEYQRFMGMLPVTAQEGFVQLKQSEVTFVYDCLLKLEGEDNTAFPSFEIFSQAAPRFAPVYEMLKSSALAQSAEKFFK